MARFSEEVLAEARKMDIVTYLSQCEPYELVKLGSGVYSVKSHDSLKISNGKWMWWSKGIGGHTALDYLIKVKGIPFRDAVQMIVGQAAIQPSVSVSTKKEELVLPERYKSEEKVIQYLSERGIAREIIQDCIDLGLVYESHPYHNVVFVGKDETGKSRYAAYRACNASRIMGDAKGSEKEYSFRLLNPENPCIHLFESAIDLLSFATIVQMNGKDYRTYNLISLAGVYLPKENEKMTLPKALAFIENENRNVKRIFLHLDNDEAGRKASEGIKELLNDRFEIRMSPPPYGKDFNEYLQLYLEKERCFGWKNER